MHLAAYYKNGSGRSDSTDFGVIIREEDRDGEVGIRFDGGTTKEVSQDIPVQWIQRQLGIPEYGDNVSARYATGVGNVSNEVLRARVISEVESGFEVRVCFNDDGVKQSIPCEWIHSF